jgi:hypothetical protein
LSAPGEVGSGKFGTPCERMHRVNPSSSCWSWFWGWSWVGWPTELNELDELGELDPQATISVEVAMAAAIHAVRSHVQRCRCVFRMLSLGFI